MAFRWWVLLTMATLSYAQQNDCQTTLTQIFQESIKLTIDTSKSFDS